MKNKHTPDQIQMFKLVDIEVAHFHAKKMEWNRQYFSKVVGFIKAYFLIENLKNENRKL